MVKVIWLRHAITAENLAKQYIGHYDVPLSNKGVAQAQQVAKFLANQPLTAIFTSDLMRAKETAAIVSEYHPNLPVQTSSDLREVFFGEWEGLTYQEIERIDRKRIYQFYDDPWNVAPPGGEKLLELQKRLERFVNQEISPYCKKTKGYSSDPNPILLVVTHGGMLRLVSALLLENDPGRYFDSSIGHGQFLITCCRGDGEWELCNL
ncbi:histidine phosphatase family protein [Brevibacillus laterosporus]|uniref:histidine phosphatase family protein n=1 Tax=Brevibacillus laterosporus TaxID=1465 RepID=UPI003D1D103B